MEFAKHFSKKSGDDLPYFMQIPRISLCSLVSTLPFPWGKTQVPGKSPCISPFFAVN